MDLKCENEGCDIPDESVHFSCLNIVQLLYGIFDLFLVGGESNNEHQCIVILNFLHRRFSRKRKFDDIVSL